MKFLLIPSNWAKYDLVMLNSIAAEINASGNQALVWRQGFYSDELLIKNINLNNIDVILAVNRLRPENVQLPKNVRFISWYQDVFIDTHEKFKNAFNDGDILYTLGSPQMLGLPLSGNIQSKCLYTGVDNWILDYKGKFQRNVDFILCGGLPAPINYHGNLSIREKADILIGRVLPENFWYSSYYQIFRLLFITKSLSKVNINTEILNKITRIVEENYSVLNGSLDIHLLNEKILESFTSNKNEHFDICVNILNKFLHSKNYFFGSIRKRLNKNVIDNLFKLYDSLDKSSPIPTSTLSYFTQSYPRILDRKRLVELAENVSFDIEVYGPGMGAHKFSEKYYKGVLDPHELIDKYQSARINLGNNTHGLGMHSRNLECMASGGLLFLHKSENDYIEGGIKSHFLVGEDYVEYTVDSFEDVASKILGRNFKEEARFNDSRLLTKEKIKKSHMWSHRVNQIYRDLRV